MFTRKTLLTRISGTTAHRVAASGQTKRTRHSPGQPATLLKVTARNGKKGSLANKHCKQMQRARSEKGCALGRASQAASRLAVKNGTANDKQRQFVEGQIKNFAVVMQLGHAAQAASRLAVENGTANDKQKQFVDGHDKHLALLQATNKASRLAVKNGAANDKQKQFVQLEREAGEQLKLQGKGCHGRSQAQMIADGRAGGLLRRKNTERFQMNPIPLGIGCSYESKKLKVSVDLTCWMFDESDLFSH
jgi:pullulanase/glycogen debranching enzyme